MDLYPIAISVFISLLFLSFVFLKFTLNDLTNKKHTNKPKSYHNSVDIVQIKQNTVCTTFKVLLKHFTIAQIFIGRISKRLILLQMAYSGVALTVYLQSAWYWGFIFSPLASLIVLIVDLLILKEKFQEKQLQSNKQSHQNKDQSQKQKIFYLIVGIAAITFHVALIGLCYKNYLNSRINSMFVYTGTILIADNFALKPIIFLLISLATNQNVSIYNLVKKYQSEYLKCPAKIANNVGGEAEQNNIPLFFEIQPQPIDLPKAKSFKKGQYQLKNILLPSLSIKDTNEINQEGSVSNILSSVESYQSAKSVSKKIPSSKDLERIEEYQSDDLKQYFCINMRNSDNKDHIKGMEFKIEGDRHQQPKFQSKNISMDFILEDFVFNSPAKDPNVAQNNNNIKIKDPEISDKENVRIQKNDAEAININTSFTKGKRSQNKSSVLKVKQELKNQLQQIDTNSPQRRNHYQPYLNQAIIEENLKTKNRKTRRRNTKAEISQPHLYQQKLSEIYCPGNRSELDINLQVNKKKTFDRARFFQNSTKKTATKGREKPIVHEHDQNLAQFYIPQF